GPKADFATRPDPIASVHGDALSIDHLIQHRRRLPQLSGPGVNDEGAGTVDGKALGSTVAERRHRQVALRGQDHVVLETSAFDPIDEIGPRRDRLVPHLAADRSPFLPGGRIASEEY